MNFTADRKLGQVGQHSHFFKNDLKVITWAPFQITSWGSVAFPFAFGLLFFFFSLKPMINLY